ncbi:substrate-binding periplasmic protein [Duganella vulcania]|uniref:substrate-binding periplasmic protein n=1 Tax=Duganella vulcania TaxID=2692166 RepID=UPI0020C4B83F|nr:ABC transporter substrate-binding protein [Duganella vulcania]
MIAAPGFAATHLTYPLTSDGIDSRYDYDWAVLRAALEKTTPRYGVFEQHQSDVAMSPPRIVQEMTSPSGRINIFVRATSPELERQFMPVRLPVDRGLLGYRLLLIRAADQQRFSKVKTIADLRRLHAGLGQGWADVPIFEKAGVPVIEGSSYEGLFAMLEAGRFDFYSRSADEALREFQERHDAHPQMAVEQTLLLHYPLPRYFFVRRDAEGKLLAKRIEAGMEMMIKDGTLDTLFQRYKGDLIKNTAMQKRRVIHLANPKLTPQTPLARGELWFNPLTEPGNTVVPAEAGTHASHGRR